MPNLEEKVKSFLKPSKEKMALAAIIAVFYGLATGLLSGFIVGDGFLGFPLPTIERSPVLCSQAVGYDCPSHDIYLNKIPGIINLRYSI